MFIYRDALRGVGDTGKKIPMANAIGIIKNHLAVKKTNSQGELPRNISS